jgi:hypothetical protein
MEPVRTLDWRALSEAASRENDPEKLIRLVEELDRALAQQDNQHRPAHSAQ